MDLKASVVGYDLQAGNKVILGEKGMEYLA